MNRIITLSLFCLTGASSLFGQVEGWTLRQCIDYALEHNISVQQIHITSENQKIRLNTAKNSRLPSVSAGLGGSGNFGLAEVQKGVYANRTNASGQLNVSANVTVYEGSRIRSEIAARTFDFQAALKDFDRAQEDVALNVTSLYLQAVLNRELVRVGENQVELSNQQLERSKVLVENGRSPQSALYESRALLANDELNLTRSRNRWLLSLLDLCQALNLENKDGFDIKTPDLSPLTLASMSDLQTPGQVYQYAVERRPRIQAENLRLKSSEKALRVARAARYPSITFGAGYGNDIFYSFNLLPGEVNRSFKEQFRNNGSERVGLNISIPIFNKLATRNNIRIAQNNIRTQQLAITEAQRVLRKEIEQSYYNADAAYEQYLSAEKALEYAREAFRYQKEKADAGRSTIFDYNDAKTRMEKAESDMISAKFEFEFRKKILDFYVGEPLDVFSY